MFGKRRPDLSARNKSWSGKTYKEKYGDRADQIKGKVLAGLKRFPNSYEKRLGSMCPSNVEYTGDRNFWIRLPAGKWKNPDFVVRPFRTTKKVIELFGNFFHRTAEKYWLLDQYQKVGINCLIIWGATLKHHPERVQRKIHEFLKS
jgi:hypothetical protein